MILSNGTDTEGEEKFYRSLFGGEDKVIELMEKCGYGNDELDCLDFFMDPALHNTSCTTDIQLNDDQLTIDNRFKETREYFINKYHSRPEDHIIIWPIYAIDNSKDFINNN